EDGIRDKLVTGVQTCALPISVAPAGGRRTAGTANNGSMKYPTSASDGDGIGRSPTSWYHDQTLCPKAQPLTPTRRSRRHAQAEEIGRASCRERGESSVVDAAL